MRFIILALVLLAATRTHAQNEIMYRVVSADNHMWSVGGSPMLTPGNGDSISFTNFTNQGATVWAIAAKGAIFVPRQTVTIMPYGPPDRKHVRVQWDITVEAQGILNDSVLELQFYFKNETYETRGNIKAIRWTDAMQRALGSFIDTTIGGTLYRARLLDEKGRITAIGEYYQNQKRYGRWLLLNDEGRIASEVKYNDDILNGQATEYVPSGREQGTYVQGRRVGKWVHQQRIGKRRWRTFAHTVYGPTGNKLLHATYYDSGGLFEEHYYDADGNTLWNTVYDTNGKLLQEGRGITLPEINLKK